MLDRQFSRREIMAGGLGVTAAAILAACGGPTVHKAVSVAPAGSDLGAVEHIVLLMQENRSFDHYFGAYPGVRGFDDPHNRAAFTQDYAGGPAHSGGRLLPFHLDTSRPESICTFDLTHDWRPQHLSWDHGTMGRFVATHTSPHYEGADNGYLTMGYYTRDDIPFHWALADHFTLCDGYHCSALGPTHPNRLHWMTGTLGADGRQGGPIVETYWQAERMWSLSWTTMPELLEDKGVSWKIYNPPGPDYVPSNTSALLWSDNMMLYFDQYQRPTTALHEKAFTPLFPSDFASDVRNGTLPAVSWIIPPIGFDEHPPAPAALGAYTIHEALSALVANPEVWSKTVFIVSWDENDGFFDHVPPPVPPAGTPGEYLTTRPLPPDASGIAGPVGLGVRVPCLVVSPFSTGGFVYHDVLDHTSQLRLIEERFGVTVPTISAWRRHTVGDLTGTLRLGSARSTVPTLPPTSNMTPQISESCTPAQLDELNETSTPYPVAFPQTMPRQEPGTAKVV